MPAAAVIPAPIAYIKVVAVKKLVVGFLRGCQCPPTRVCSGALASFCYRLSAFACRWSAQRIYLEKIRVFQAGFRRNTLAWNNGIGLRSRCWFEGLQ